MKQRSIFILMSMFFLECKTVTPRPYEKISAEHIYQNLQDQKKMFQDAPIELQGKIKTVYSLSLLIARPGFVKVSIPPGGEIDSKFILVTDGKQFHLKNAQSKPVQFLQGEAKPCVLPKLLPDWGMELSANDFVEVLLGQPPLLPEDQLLQSEVVWDPHGTGQEVLTLYGKNGQIQRIWLTRALLGHVVKVESYQVTLNNLVWRVEYKGFKIPPGFSMGFPEETIFTSVKQKKSLSITWKKWFPQPEDLEEPWQNEFQLVPPPQFPIYEVTCDPVA